MISTRGVSWREFNWKGGLFLTGYHLLLVVSLPLYLYCVPLSQGLIPAALILYVLGGLGITAGYHRLYSHRAYNSHPILEAGLLFFGTLAAQASALEWAHDHRLHHRHVDTDRDPYGTKNGFWHSHLWWMFKKRKTFDTRVVSDLMRNPLVRFQDQYYGLLLLATNAVCVILVGWLFTDYLGAFVIAFLARMFLIHHTTWFINSLAHIWGSKPFSTEHSAVNNWILGLLTFGEGYHNYHHTFAGDYRNGVRWYQWDLTKFFIWSASKVGLARDLRRVKASAIKSRLLWLDRKWMLEQIRGVSHPAAELLKEKITTLSESLLSKVKQRDKLASRAETLKKTRVDKGVLSEVRSEIRALEKTIGAQSRSWARLCRQVFDHPAPRVFE